MTDMNPKIVIRSETEADLSAIAEVIIAAFKTLEISNHTEQFVIEALRAARALTVSLVAEVDGRVIGHVPPEVFFTLSFDGHTPRGTVTFHEGFKADGQQVAPEPFAATVMP